jgi:hemoglobin-like flavoprotein
MKLKQRLLVRESFIRVLPIANIAAGLFYQRLFELDPSLRVLFKGDMTEQGRKLMSTIKMAVYSLERWDEIRPALQELGRRHAHYGVTAKHYDTVAEALLWMLAQGLGEAFTPEVREAWIELYTSIAATMQEAAAEAVVAMA